MVDQEFMRMWVSNHERFSGDMDRGLRIVAKSVATFFKRHLAIRSVYAVSSQAATPLARSLMAGFAASLMTIALVFGANAFTYSSLAYA